jgi:hypothetical protein
VPRLQLRGGRFGRHRQWFPRQFLHYWRFFWHRFLRRFWRSFLSLHALDRSNE